MKLQRSMFLVLSLAIAPGLMHCASGDEKAAEEPTSSGATPDAPANQTVPSEPAPAVTEPAPETPAPAKKKSGKAKAKKAKKATQK